MEAQKVERSIADMMKENPSAFDFNDIPDAVPGKASAGTSATLTQILGGFTLFGTDEVTGLAFYGRKPKVSGLERLIDLINTPVIEEGADGIATMRAVVRRSCEVAAMLLYVQDGGKWRPATPEEIGEAFDLAELNRVRDLFSGLTVAETPEGNA